MTGLSFSPFSWLFETRKYPHAHTLRSSFLQKLKDSFIVCTGSFDFLSKSMVIGLFDYVTGFIPLLCIGILLWGLKNVDKPWGKVVFVPALLLNTPLLLCRALFGAIFMLSFSLVTLIVHGISRIVGQNTMNNALGYGTVLAKSDEKYTLSAFLKDHNCSLDTLSSSLTADKIILLDSKSQASLKLEISAADENLETCYPALFALNVGGLQYTIEKGMQESARIKY